jgi:hypothetical protein
VLRCAMAARTDKCCVLAGAVMAHLVLLSCVAATPSSPAAPLAADTQSGRTPASAATVALAGRQAQVSHWPEATARFRSNGPWLGADSAYSVDLGEGRVLWLFGDTFIDPTRDGSRTNGPNQFVRNSVAIQTAPNEAARYDLSQSEIRFFTGPARDGAASSFFPETAEGDWFWPLSGIRLSDGPLLLFRMRVHKVSTGFGFAVTGWDAVAVDDPNAEPDHWILRPVVDQSTGAERLVGASVMQHGDYLYAYAAKNTDDDHALFLARVSLATLKGLSRAALSDFEWYTAHGFQRQSEGATPVPVLAGGQIEISVHFQPQLQRFVEIQTRGLFASDPQTAIVARTSERPEGPWSDPVRIWVPSTPRHADPNKLLTYAAKAHPEQRGADLVLTYMQNDVSSLTPIDAVYYPEMLRVRF